MLSMIRDEWKTQFNYPSRSILLNGWLWLESRECLGLENYAVVGKKANTGGLAGDKLTTSRLLIKDNKL
jgi:hypothetical protein